MKIDTTKELMSISGQPLQNEDRTSTTLRHVIQNALLGGLQGDEKLSGADKLALWNLAKRASRDEAEFNVEELATIKERIGRAYGPVVVGPAYEIIDPS